MLNSNGDSALKLAVFGGHTKVVQQLLFAGAKVDIQSHLNGRTALHAAMISRWAGESPSIWYMY